MLGNRFYVSYKLERILAGISRVPSVGALLYTNVEWYMGIFSILPGSTKYSAGAIYRFGTLLSGAYFYLRSLCDSIYFLIVQNLVTPKNLHSFWFEALQICGKGIKRGLCSNLRI